jgi:hypothetical protein
MRLHSFFLLIALFAAANNSGDKLRMLKVGTFHGDEVTARTGEHWLALTKVGHAFRLKPVVLEIDRVHDEIVDENEHQRSGKNVEIRPELDALALVRGAGLVAGPVITAGENIAIDGSTEKPLALGAAHYTLALHCQPTPPVDGQQQERCELSISEGHNTRKLAAFTSYKEHGHREFAGERVPTVLWAGDMDHDGRLDLLIDTTNHYNVEVISLFLSSQARKPVHFTASGC